MSEFERQFPKPEPLGDFDDVLLDCWKEKRKGWLAALKWQSSIDSWSTRDKLLKEEIDADE